MLAHRSGPSAVLHPSATTTRLRPQDHDHTTTCHALMTYLPRNTVTRHDRFHLAAEKSIHHLCKGMHEWACIVVRYVQRRYGIKRRSSAHGYDATGPFERHVPTTDPKPQDSSEQFYGIENNARSKESIPRATANASNGNGISPAGQRPRWNAEVVHLAKATVRPAR